MLTGRVVLRTPAGEEELGPMDVVCFPPGPEGAHKVTNRTDEPARILILSTTAGVNVAVYPDSDKLGIFTPNDDDDLLVRRESGVDYWDREL